MFSDNNTSNAHQPFSGYTDDPDKEEARQFRHIKPARGNILPYIVVCFATSIFWGGLLYLFHPTSTLSPLAASSNSPLASAAETFQPPGLPSTTDRHNITHNAHLLTCGTTVASAKANGCKYDILLNNWVPAPCYDQEFIDEYVDDDSWGGFADEAMTQKLKVQEMSEREYYWTSLRDHVNHCAMLWRKQFWVLYEERRAFDTVIASPGHTDHCAQFLVDVGERNWTHPTKTEMGFAGCWVREDR